MNVVESGHSLHQGESSLYITDGSSTEPVVLCCVKFHKVFPLLYFPLQVSFFHSFSCQVFSTPLGQNPGEQPEQLSHCLTGLCWLRNPARNDKEHRVNSSENLKEKCKIYDTDQGSQTFFFSYPQELLHNSTRLK